jgi:hypothetical protein
MLAPRSDSGSARAPPDSLGGYLLTGPTIKGLAGLWSRCSVGSLSLRLPTRCGYGFDLGCVPPGTVGEGWLKKGLLCSR